MAAYRFSDQQAWLASVEAQRAVFFLSGWARGVFETAGAFMSGKAMTVLSRFGVGDTFQMTAVLDRLVELGQLRELTGPEVWGQHRVFVAADAPMRSEVPGKPGADVSVSWRGSPSDLATDLEPLLTVEQLQELACELTLKWRERRTGVRVPK